MSWWSNRKPRHRTNQFFQANNGSRAVGALTALLPYVGGGLVPRSTAQTALDDPLIAPVSLYRDRPSD